MKALKGTTFVITSPTPSDEEHWPAVATIFAWSKDLEEALRETRIDRLSIGNWHDAENDITFLAGFSDQIRSLALHDPSVGSLSVINSLSNLEELWVTSARGALPIDQIDFSKLTRLRICTIEHPRSTSNVRACTSLRSLSLVGRGLSDLSAIAPLRQLEELDLCGAPLQSLDGIAILPRLRTLRLRRMPVENLDGLEQTTLETLWLESLRRLRSLEPLTKSRTLRALDIVGCRQVSDVTCLGAVTSLEILGINNQGALPSISFLRTLSQLQEFRCGMTEITDDDLSPLFQLARLKRAGFLPHRRSYSHTQDQIGEYTRLNLARP